MKAQTPQGGRIINIGSVSQKTPRPDSLPYTVCKFGLQGMTHQLTMDGRKHNIVASIIHPGATLSSFTTRRGRTKAGPGATPDDYVMAAEDVAKVAVLMAALPAGGESVRGDDLAEPHAELHRAGIDDIGIGKGTNPSWRSKFFAPPKQASRLATPLTFTRLKALSPCGAQG